MKNLEKLFLTEQSFYANMVGDVAIVNSSKEYEIRMSLRAFIEGFPW